MVNHAHKYWGVTVEISVRFRKPVPLDQELRVIGRITRDAKRVFEGTGEILLSDGSIAAEAKGKYMKLPLDKIADFNEGEQNWEIHSLPEDPDFIEIDRK